MRTFIGDGKVIHVRALENHAFIKYNGYYASHLLLVPRNSIMFRENLDPIPHFVSDTHTEIDHNRWNGVCQTVRSWEQTFQLSFLRAKI